jgi:hypothetical protein
MHQQRVVRRARARHRIAQRLEDRLRAGAVDEQQHVGIDDVRMLEADVEVRPDPRFAQFLARNRRRHRALQRGDHGDEEHRFQVKLMVGEIEHPAAVQSRVARRIDDLHPPHKALHQRQRQVLDQRAPRVGPLAPEALHRAQVEIGSIARVSHLPRIALALRHHLRTVQRQQRAKSRPSRPSPSPQRTQRLLR